MRDEARPRAALAQAYAYCESLLREHDKDRFLADLFLPASVRPHAQALQAFSLEIARVRELVSEPMPGELRHQWWRDALSGDVRGDIGANPVAAALIDTLERLDLPRANLEALIDARGLDLYDEPMPDVAALESYCGDTSSILFKLVGRMLDATAPTCAEQDRGEYLADEAAEEAGLAYAFTGLIRAFALHAAQGRIYLPGDLLRRHGSSPEEALSGRSTPALLAAIGDWRGEARRHLAAAKTAIGRVPKPLRSAFLPLALVEPYLRQTEKRDYDPFRTPVELAQWRRQWILWRGSSVS
jgi:phytoene synthase